MYTVHLDFVLRYLPPMADIAHGIRLTRTFELPFPPTEKMLVFSKEWEGQDDPMGYVLKEVTWDIDRSCFLADTELSSSGVPIALIPLDIRASWILDGDLAVSKTATKPTAAESENARSSLVCGSGTGTMTK